MIQIENLSIRYGNRLALKNIQLEIREGETLALLGPNGSGKSTLLRSLAGLLPTAAGTVRLSGRQMNTLNPAERARQISLVPQNALLPPAFTAWETVLLGRSPYLNFLGQVSPADEKIARAALERVDALSLAERRIGELSGGEAQRILLARALAQSTPVLLLDEPTTHLDIQHQMGLLELIRKLSAECTLTVVIALHDLNLAARYADRLALLVDGELKALGTAKEVLRAEILSAVYRWPVQVVEHPFLNGPLILPEHPQK